MKKISIFIGITFFLSLTSVAATINCSEMTDILLARLSFTNEIVDPCSLKPYKLRYVSTALFFAAHPDDETIGMAGLISRFVSRDTQVIVEMMTDGQGSSAIHRIRSSGHQITGPAFGHARQREFIDSMRKLKVHAIVLNDFKSLEMTIADVKTRLDCWAHEKVHIEYLIGTAGHDHDSADHPDHEKIYQAIKESTLVPSKYKKWTLIYVYRNSERKKVWHEFFNLNVQDCSNKKNALKSFNLWAPNEKRYAIGWRNSTPDIFESAYADCQEYIVSDKTQPFPWKK